MKKFYTLIFLLFCISFFSQSRKEQIGILQIRVDSFKTVLNYEKQINDIKTKNINDLNNNIDNYQKNISNLNLTILKLKEDLEISKLNYITTKNELERKNEQLSGEINILSIKLTNKKDSLNKLIDDYNKLKNNYEQLSTKVNSETDSKINNTSIKEKNSSDRSNFKTIKIGSQVWMTDNLNVSTFRNGDIINEAKSEKEWEAASNNKQPAWCYYDNDPKNGAKYGKLYNWYAVNDSRGLAPKGFHIPSNAEWDQLSDYLGVYEKAGTKMKSNSDWNNNGNGTNESGFSGLPGGFCFGYGTFTSIGNRGIWWSSSEAGTNDAWVRELVFCYGFFEEISHGNGFGLSVRCLRD